MKITALDIRKQEFARTFRGYDPDEVDSFLQVIATGWQEMVDDLRRSQEKIEEQQMKLEHYMKVEEALEEALQTARSSARQTIESAEKKATTLLEDAENRIVHLQKEADANRLEIKRETARYAVRQQEIVAKLRAFLVSEMEMLRHFEADTGERTLQQPAGRREIEMYRDESAGNPEQGEAEGATPMAAPIGGSADTSDQDDMEHEGDVTSDAPAHAEDREAYSAESSDYVDDETSEDDWEDDDADESEAEAAYDDEDEWDDEDDWEEDDFLEEDQDGVSLASSHEEGSDEDEEQGNAPGWRVTPVFDSASDSGEMDSAASDLEALPDDGADDEIRKIHEILKGLDEEQDAEED